jgi:hypothetical protein
VRARVAAPSKRAPIRAAGRHRAWAAQEGGVVSPPPKPLRITGVGRRGGEARRARRVDHEFHSVAQARAWTDGGCDAGRGFAFDGVGARPHRVVGLRHTREPTPGGPGSGLRRGRRRFLCQLPLWRFYTLLSICASKNVYHHSSYLGSLCNAVS